MHLQCYPVLLKKNLYISEFADFKSVLSKASCILEYIIYVT